MQEYIQKFKSLPKRERILYVSILVFLVAIFTYIYIHRPPKNFPLNEVITINPGESLQEITNSLYEQNVIKLPFIFRTTVILLGGERKVIAGDYLLDEKVGPVDIAYRLIKGNFHLEAKRVTIFEGYNIFDIADVLSEVLVDFNKDEFIKIAKDKEGYLFPDTYFINSTARPKSVVTLMNQNFESKINSLTGIATSTHPLEDIITMASIIETEANNLKDKKIISGVLWKRIEMGMPLQVDVTFSYINGKNSYELTLDDLKIDSPYNTYKYKGLPPGPIANPGMDSIIAALYPTKTKYLYFLASRDGKIYYARTFDEHKINRQKYL